MKLNDYRRLYSAFFYAYTFYIYIYICIESGQ